jgi:hypothetical protein
MKGRQVAICVLLAMAAAACAGPDVVGGNDVIQESESVTNDGGSDDTSTTDQGSATDPDAVFDDTAANEGAIDPGEETTSTIGEESSLVTNLPKDTPSTATTSPTVSGGGTVDSGLMPMVDQAKADLAGRLGIDAGEIALISAELVEWSDASLGCPQPGMVYAQVPTDGSLIVLSHGGAEYPYHTGGSVYVPFLCE